MRLIIYTFYKYMFNSIYWSINFHFTEYFLFLCLFFLFLFFVFFMVLVYNINMKLLIYKKNHFITTFKKKK